MVRNVGGITRGFCVVLCLMADWKRRNSGLLGEVKYPTPLKLNSAVINAVRTPCATASVMTDFFLFFCDVFCILYCTAPVSKYGTGPDARTCFFKCLKTCLKTAQLAADKISQTFSEIQKSCVMLDRFIL